MVKSQNYTVWILRILVGVVLFFNVQCAITFLINPESYIASFELTGEVGKITLRGFGILFLMWNVPYVFAVVHPMKNFKSLIEANIMQFIGFVGESILLYTGTGNHVVLESSIQRFVLFDGAGLILLIIAGWMAHRFHGLLKSMGFSQVE